MRYGLVEGTTLTPVPGTIPPRNGVWLESQIFQRNHGGKSMVQCQGCKWGALLVQLRPRLLGSRTFTARVPEPCQHVENCRVWVLIDFGKRWEAERWDGQGMWTRDVGRQRWRAVSEGVYNRQ